MLARRYKLNLRVITLQLALLCLLSHHVRCNDDGVISEDPGAIDINDLDLQADDSSPVESGSTSNEAKDRNYARPQIKSDGLYLFDSFDDPDTFKQNWIQSKDQKYNGRWKLESGPDHSRDDLQMVLPEKARHYGISAKLIKPFKFGGNKPLVVQYEVQFREGLDCGGAYVKLLRNSAIDDLTKLTDKTPFTIMFGPDKCGNEAKLHFIVQYFNPKTQEYSEKHWKQAKYVSNLASAFSDKKHHLFRLVLDADNKFELFLDGNSVGKGDLLEDMDPPINPPKEIVDLDDKRPEDWDERPQIEDPDARKPDDWDETAPQTIDDPNAVKPEDWLENEPIYIPDPSAKKPDDWEEMDGEWEPPKIENPACAKVSGCGPWKVPQIPNPAYKGKWRPPKIDNPNYKGKWSPRMIPNPDYFYDEKPFSSLDPIGAVAFELWSMADNVAFDNLIISDDVEPANSLQLLTWQSKKAEADASSPSLVTRAMHYLNVQPWLWAVVVLAVALPLFLFISYCCDTKRSQKQTDAARRKKTDEPAPDDEASTSRKDDDNDTSEEIVKEDEDEDEEVSEDEDEETNKKDSGDTKTPSKRQVRQRKAK